MNHLVPQYAYAGFCLFFAFVNYWQIEKLNENVRHFINGIFHATTSLYFGIAVHWALGVAILIEARLVFDITLNLLRFGVFGFFYVSPNPKSIVDRIEKSVFKENGVIPKVIYVVTIIIINLCIL